MSSREVIDRRMSKAVAKNVFVPLAHDLGARYIFDDPVLGNYNHENKTITHGLGWKHEKRQRTTLKQEGIYYKDGEKIQGKTTIIPIDQRVGWSRKHDNRLVQNDQTVTNKIVSFEESFNKLRTFSSLDIAQQFTASGKGEILGIGGSVSTTSSIHAHTEVETEKFNRTKKERIIEDTVRIFYPGPVRDDTGKIIREGEIWLIERPVLTLQTITPMTQWGIWDCAKITFNLYDWAGNNSIMPGGEHKNELEFNGLDDVLAFMRRESVLRWKWSKNYRPSKASRKGMEWLADEENRKVGPVEWDEVRLNEDVAALEPSIVEA